ncbi:MAG: amidohydrolase family protein [Balneolales bacterium]|nr:amidohydrolase family protein [Balneolales bacterium]
MKLLRKSFFRLSLLLSFASFTYNAHAQSDPTGNSPATNTYAITNATIVQAPGKQIEGGTLIISNGLITAVGTNINIPANAEVIDGTDMYVYPGFIDGMSNTGAARPDAMERPEDLFTPDPPNDYAGITPEMSVKFQLDIEENSINNMRKLGFTISHTVPHGRMLPGSGSLILLKDGEHADDLIMEENVSMYTQFQGAPGAYPGNTLGIMAKWRNLYRNADLAKQHTEMYASNPAGLPRPTQDRVLQAFYPVVDRSQPVFYNANSILEAQRAMRLQSELGFNLALGNLEEGWEMVGDLSGSGVTVFLSLNIPEEPEVKEDGDKTEEVAALEQRRLDFYNKQMSQFSAMDAEGIKFGFSTMGATASKIKSNLVSIVEHGLDSVQALAALTIDAAELLGIDAVTGTLDEGKIGNAVVTTGPYFHKDSGVKYVFVDGDKYEYEIRESGGGEVSEEEAAGIVGTWVYTSSSPRGEQTGTMVFTRQAGELTGILTSDSGQPDRILNNISFRDGTLTFDYAFEAGGQGVEIVVTGEIDGDEFEGETSISAFNISFPIVATKEVPQQ